MSVSPASLTYANQTVGTASATQTVTISNTGGTSLTVNSITNSNTADFGLTAPATPLTINGGASQTFTVAFHPATSGAKSATISITSTAGNASVSASGTGVDIVTQPILSVSPLSLTFSNVTVNTSSTKTVTISNTGNASLTITSMILTGSSAFSLSPASFAPIAAGANATLTVTYSPTVLGIDPGAAISIASNGGNATVSLAGSAVQQTAGDIALVKGSGLRTISNRVGRKYEMKLVAFATTTAEEAEATVTLKAVYPAGLQVSINESSITKALHSGSEPTPFEFEANVTCNKKGTWPVKWTATISSSVNSNPANDVLSGTTQVTCFSNAQRD